MGHPRASFSFIFVFSNTRILQQIYMKNVHPVYGAGIRTHNLQRTSLLPKPLDLGSRIVFITPNLEWANHSLIFLWKKSSMGFKLGSSE